MEYVAKCKRHLWRYNKTIGTLFVAMILIGCSVKTNEITDDERLKRANDDMSGLFNNQDPITGPVTLGEAIARSLKYNLDHKVKMMELAVANKNLKVANVSLLPQIVASAGYVTRNNDSGASSRSLLTGEESLEPSTSQERDRDTADLDFAWNVLDFGVSYVTTKQRQDDVRIAQERRRKVTQNIMQDVRSAYWRALAAQKLFKRMDDLMFQVENTLYASKSAGDSTDQAPKDSLLFQRKLLETKKMLWTMRDEFVSSKTRLGTLMNIKPGTEFEVADVELSELMPVKLSLQEMEMMALLNRPEVREEDYRLRIDQLDVRKSFYQMFPNFEITSGASYDSNKYLYNNDWVETGFRVSLNLFNLINAKANKAYNQAKVDLSDARRAALSLAVITQVHVALNKYEISRSKFASESELSQVNKNLMDLIDKDLYAETGFSKIQSKASSLVSEMQKMLAYAEAQNALGRIYNSIGVDPLPNSVVSHDIVSLSNAIDERNGKLNPSTIPQFVKSTHAVEDDSLLSYFVKLDQNQESSNTLADDLLVKKQTVITQSNDNNKANLLTQPIRQNTQSKPAIMSTVQNSGDKHTKDLTLAIIEYQKAIDNIITGEEKEILTILSGEKNRREYDI